MQSPSYATILRWLSEIWATFDQDLIRRSFEENGIVPSLSKDPYHSALTQTLSGVDVQEYLEDVVEEEQLECCRSGIECEVSRNHVDSDSSDSEFELDSEDLQTSDDDSDKEIVDLLNKSTIIDGDTDVYDDSDNQVQIKSTKQQQKKNSTNQTCYE